MQRTELNIHKSRWAIHPEILMLALCVAGSISSPSKAQQLGQKTFSSAEEASNALITAMQTKDTLAMVGILGPAGNQSILSEGKDDKSKGANDFVEQYREMHRLVKQPDGSTILYIGANSSRTPISLRNENGLWYFDRQPKKDDIQYSPINRNEMLAIHVCQELVAAERSYYSVQRGEYARTIFSDHGERKGLYSQAADGKPQSSIGPLLASAVAGGYAKDKNPFLVAYHGYSYRILMGEGKSGRGGPKNYIVNGKMTGGFAFEAYPSDYGSSGLVTFMVNQDGLIYQKDLGKKTSVLAKTMKQYDPDASWQRVEEENGGATVGESQTEWQAGTIIAVKTHQTPGNDSSNASYEVSVKVGTSVYVMLCTPQLDTGEVMFETGRGLEVLVGENTITYNDILGRSFQEPILSRATLGP